MPTHSDEPRTEIEAAANAADNVVADDPLRNAGLGVEHLARGLRAVDTELERLHQRIDAGGLQPPPSRSAESVLATIVERLEDGGFSRWPIAEEEPSAEVLPLELEEDRRSTDEMLSAVVWSLQRLAQEIDALRGIGAGE